MTSRTSSVFPLDLEEIPAIGSRDREAHEEAALARGRELIQQEDGRLRDALYLLDGELRDGERPTRKAVDIARTYARSLVAHVEQCWATAVLR